MVKVYVKLLRFNKGKSDEYATIKSVINLKDVSAEIPEDEFKSLIRFITEENIAIDEKFNGITDTYDPHFRVGDLLVMPRFMFQRIRDYLKSRAIVCEVIHSPYVKGKDREFGNLKIKLYEDKITVIDTIIAELKSDNGLIVKLDTGKGKSVIIAEVIRRMGLLTNIIVKDSTLQRQMFKDLHESLQLDCENDCTSEVDTSGCMSKNGLSKCKYIALLGGTKSMSNVRLLESHGYKILISIINSAKDKELTFWMKFGMTVFDECHNYTSEKNSAIYRNSQTQYMLGLSATPTKRWNHMMLEHNIGKIVDFDAHIVSKVKLKGVVRKINYRGSPEYTKMLKNVRNVMSVAKMVKQFMEDEARNDLLIRLIISAVREHGYGFVFAMRNDFLVKLKSRLDAESPR